MLGNSTEDRSFALRLVRFIAWLAIVCCVFAAVRDFYLMRVNGVPTLPSTRLGVKNRLLNTIYFTKIAINLVLGIAAIGVLRRKSWGRVCLLTWVGLTILTETTSYVLAFLEVQDYYREHPNPNMTGMYIFWSMWGEWLRMLAPAIATLFIFRQQAVAALFRRSPTGGFEPIPMARVAQK